MTGKYNAIQMETSNIIVKPDGTYEPESKGIQLTEMAILYSSPRRGEEEVSGPCTVTGEGEVNFQTSSAKLAWLNST